MSRLTICCDGSEQMALYAGVAQWPGHQPSKLGMRVRFPSPAPPDFSLSAAGMDMRL